MSHSFKILLSIILVLTIGFAAKAQLSAEDNPNKTPPAVFQIGEYETQFEGLSFSYNTSLLAACEDNMDLAYVKWLDMLQNMQEFGKSNGVDLNGVKMWMNVFWSKEGKIDHVVYFLKPQSKNIDRRFLDALINEFAEIYQFPMTYPGNFSHYGIANFPVFPSTK